MQYSTILSRIRLLAMMKIVGTLFISIPMKYIKNVILPQLWFIMGGPDIFSKSGLTFLTQVYFLQSTRN